MGKIREGKVNYSLLYKTTCGIYKLYSTTRRPVLSNSRGAEKILLVRRSWADLVHTACRHCKFMTVPKLHRRIGGETQVGVSVLFL